MSEKLRHYQARGIQAIFSAWREGKRSVLFQMPTGTGKTVVFSEIVRLGYLGERKILIVAHRTELIYQITGKLSSRGVEAGVILSGHEADYEKTIQVASIQTLTRREHPEADLIIIDECHHAKAESYRKLWEIYPEARFLGVTATPIRLNGEGFEDLFDILISSNQIREFIGWGYLSPIRHYIGATPDLKSVKKRNGDYVPESLSRVMMDEGLMINLVASYKKYTPGRSAIVFAVNVAHSEEIAGRYREAGIPASHIDANTPKTVRARILDEFKTGKIKVISNVDIITEGFDFPECEVVQLARPTWSLALYLQMVGRVMRIAEGKAYGVVLDNAGLWLKHGLPTIDRQWSLEGKAKKTGEEQSRLIAINERGVICEINRNIPEEINGCELIEVTGDMERLVMFESYVREASTRNYKILYAFYKYRDYLRDQRRGLTEDEFEYIKRRLNDLNRSAEADKTFNPRFWHVQRKLLQVATI